MKLYELYELYKVVYNIVTVWFADVYLAPGRPFGRPRGTRGGAAQAGIAQVVTGWDARALPGDRDRDRHCARLGRGVALMLYNMLNETG